MILKSGNCKQGVIGTLTGLKDCCGNELKVGDVALLLNIEDYDKSKNRITDQYGLEFVCEETGDGGTELGCFVMGIANDYNNFNNIITENNSDFQIFKVKDCSKVVNGEQWGIVKAAEDYNLILLEVH